MNERALVTANDYCWRIRENTVWFPQVIVESPDEPQWNEPYTTQHSNREPEFWYHFERVAPSQQNRDALQLLTNSFNYVVYIGTPERPWWIAWLSNGGPFPASDYVQVLTPCVALGWFYAADRDLALRLITGWLYFSQDPKSVWYRPVDANNNMKPSFFYGVGPTSLAAWGMWLNSPAAG
jgi:hypothetical protein